MNCLSLFGSVTVAACLTLTPLAAMDFWPNYQYEGQSPNRLRAAPLPNATTTRNETSVPWYERLPELRPPHEQSVDASDIRSGSPALGQAFPSASDLYEARDGIARTNNAPFSYARQQRAPVVGQAEPLPAADHAFDSLIQSPDSYSTLSENRDAKQGWGRPARGRCGLRNGCCETLWQAGADFYYLKRTATAPVTILVDNTTRTIEEFNAQSLGFDYNAGYGARLSRSLGCCASLDFRYFGLFDQQASIERTGDVALVVPGFATGGNPASYNSDYDSQLHSAEVNIRQTFGGRFGLLAGFRYINLQENLLISSQIGAVVTPQHYNIDVDNNLYGAQLGTDVSLARWGSIQLDALVKVGFYLNDASQTTSSALIGTPVTAMNDSFALVGEAGVYATYWINDNWSVRAGYQVLGLQDVALAPEQLQQSNLGTGTANIDTSGSAFYGGATVGAQYVW